MFSSHTSRLAMNPLVRTAWCRVSRIILCLLAVFFVAQPIWNPVAAERVRLLPLHNVAGDIALPFPAEPTRLQDMFEDGSRLAIYNYVDESSSTSYTATVMQDRSPEMLQGDADALIKEYLAGVLVAMDGRAQREGNLTIDGRPARYVVASMGVVDHVARSYSVAIYDDGKIHTWAIQDVPTLTGEAGATAFAENVERIRLGEPSAGSSRSTTGGDASHKALESAAERPHLEKVGRVEFPFPERPTGDTMSLHGGKAFIASYREPASGRVYLGAHFTGLPTVHDPVKTLLRGARGGQPVSDEGVITIDGFDGRYMFFPNEAPSTGGTYTVAFEVAGDLYQWSFMGDMKNNHSFLRSHFFEMAETIRVR